MATIAVDLDDVLTESAKHFIEFGNATWGHDHTVEDYSEDWLELWGVGLEEGNRRSKLWHDSKDYDNREPLLEAIEALRTMSQKHKLVVVTSRRDWVKDRTIDWVNEYFGDIFDGVHFAGMWEKGSHEERVNTTKAETVKSVGADLLIDDQPKHCLGVRDVGIDVILFGDYPWNRDSHDDFDHAKNWDEVVKHVEQRFV